MVEQGALVEHGTSRTGRWLRARRLRAALGIAVIEGILVVFHVIPWWLAVIVAAAIVFGYFSSGRRLRSDAARQIAWIAAVSQAAVALVPVLLLLVSTVVLIAVAAIAIVALIVLLSDRG